MRCPLGSQTLSVYNMCSLWWRKQLLLSDKRLNCVWSSRLHGRPRMAGREHKHLPGDQCLYSSVFALVICSQSRHQLIVDTKSQCQICLPQSGGPVPCHCCCCQEVFHQSEMKHLWVYFALELKQIKMPLGLTSVQGSGSQPS